MQFSGKCEQTAQAGVMLEFVMQHPRQSNLVLVLAQSIQYLVQLRSLPGKPLKVVSKSVSRRVLARH